MTRSKKRRTGGAESNRSRTVKIIKRKKRRTGGAESEEPEEGSSMILRHEFLARLLEGGASATPEAYAHAIVQWQQLPGAVLSRTPISRSPVRHSTAVPTANIDTERGEQPS
jgi:hypothetical protein